MIASKSTDNTGSEAIVGIPTDELPVDNESKAIIDVSCPFNDSTDIKA